MNTSQTIHTASSELTAQFAQLPLIDFMILTEVVHSSPPHLHRKFYPTAQLLYNINSDSLFSDQLLAVCNVQNACIRLLQFIRLL